MVDNKGWLVALIGLVGTEPELLRATKRTRHASAQLGLAFIKLEDSMPKLDVLIPRLEESIQDLQAWVQIRKKWMLVLASVEVELPGGLMKFLEESIQGLNDEIDWHEELIGLLEDLLALPEASTELSHEERQELLKAAEFQLSSQDAEMQLIEKEIQRRKILGQLLEDLLSNASNL